MVRMKESNITTIYESEVYESLLSFLNNKFKISSSKDTRLSYESDLRNFFSFLYNSRPIETLRFSDIELKRDTIDKYQSHLLIDCELNPRTVNRRIITIKQFYNRLVQSELMDQKVMLSFNLVAKLKETKSSHGIITINEMWQMANKVLNQKRGRKKLTKYYLILFSTDTCLRKSAILNLKWNDFIVHENEVEIKAIDKGNEEQNRIISKEFYNELLQLKDEKSSDNENFDEDIVFKISNDGIQSMMEYLKKELNISDKRNIVFHSFRKAGVTFQYRLTGDIMQAKQAAGHSSLNNTMLYVEKSHNNVMGAVSNNTKINETLYKEISHEELLKAIEELTVDQKFMINLKIKSMITK